jgi:hypothetical protein
MRQAPTPAKNRGIFDNSCAKTSSFILVLSRGQKTCMSCSMQMLTDWSRTMFLKVVFTSIIISSYVELCETVYLFVFRIRRIFMCSIIV